MHPEPERIRQTAIFYNQLINFFWSIPAFVPVIIFCYSYLPLNLLYLFTGISCLIIFMPVHLIDKIQLSHSAIPYKRIGIRFIKKFTQDGDLINQFIKKRHPQYKYVENKEAIKKLIGKTYINEKFHYLVFVFFTCITIHACTMGLIAWGIFISIANIVYNVYPIFLQQYTRIRINSLLKNSQ